MILYKYVSFSSAQKVIESSTLGFSCLEDLNDPFEARALRFSQSNSSNISESTVINAYRNRLSRHFGILSLTRQPLNPLMWAHYGDSHVGAVVGIDVKMAGLTCEKTSVIPAQYGEIIYTQTKPYSPLQQSTSEKLINVGKETQSFNSHDFELFKQAFLYKSTTWAYEEEVRVVKNINSKESISRYKNAQFKNDSGSWNQVVIDGRPLYCLQIPEESFVEVYLGTSTYKNVSHRSYSKEEYSDVVSTWRSKNIKVYNCRPKMDTWDLERYTNPNIN